ncbi:MAG: transcriptional regulator with XRE-family HTH domain [Polaribacter sp.]|jgi:transcriptional regulator with XRE-family HTH domain
MIVKKLRAEKKWSQDQLAILSGLSVRTIQRVESGQSASMETLKSLASIFEVDINKLTEVITMIDKKSENWAVQPWWFRLLFFGISSRRNQLLAEFSILVFGLIALFYFENKFAVAGFFIASYITGLAVRYGDNKDVW